MLSTLTSKKTLNAIDKIAKPFKDLPHLPQVIIDFLVTAAPWLVGLGGIFNLFGALSSLKYAFGRSTVSKMMQQYVGLNSTYFLIITVLQLAMAWLAFKAFQPLKEKEIVGWIYVFWSNVVAIAQMIVGLIYLGGSGVGAVVGVLIGLYLLFEVKSSYNGKKEIKKED